MDPGVLPWEAWVRSTGLSHAVLGHAWAWPALETLHYLGLSLLLGTVGLFDLRMLGLARAIPLTALHRLVPLGVCGFVLNLLTGVGFFAGFPDQYAYNNAFRLKLALIALAGLNVAVFYAAAFGVLRRLPEGARPPPAARFAAAASLALWIGVLVCGRLLTFFRPPFFH